MPVAAAPARGWEARKGQAHILAAHGLYITIPHYLSYTHIGKRVHGGWLYKVGGDKYFLEDCGKPGRISRNEIRTSWQLEDHFTKNFLAENEGGFFSEDDDEMKSAKYKYQLFGENSRKASFIEIPKDKQSKDSRVKYKVEEILKEDSPIPSFLSGDIGTLVFTGQPSARKENSDPPSGKIYEFIFWEPQGSAIEIEDSSIIDDFKTAYLDHKNEKEQSEDWKYWKYKLEKGEKIPVFFLCEEKNEKRIERIGLSQLFKFAYKNSIEDAIHQKAPKEATDLAGAIFGYIQNEGSQTDEESLKGRVHFGHAFLKSGNVGEVQTEVLSSPKASYYPHYVRQSINSNGKVKNKYKTFMDDDASIAGWKRYPIHRSGVKHNPRPAETSEKIETNFIPLKEGAIFDSVIRFHNLQPIELGALLSALTFHSDQDAFHALGMAKPLGYGKVKLDVKLQGNDLKSDEYYLKQFEAYMRTKIKNWNNSDQICELIAMAHEHTNTGRSELSYMGLDGFRRAKNNNEALDKYSKLLNLKDGAFRIKTVATDEDMKSMEIWINREKSLYESKSSPEEALKNYKEQQYEKLNQALEQYKAQQIKAIKDQQSAIQAAEKEQRLQTEAAEARQNPPDWGDIDLNKRKAFDELKKVIQNYVEAYYGDNYNRLVKDKEEGVLPEEHRHAFTKKIVTLASEGHKTEKKQLSRSPFERNSYFKKIREWVGEEQARELWEKING